MKKRIFLFIITSFFLFALPFASVSADNDAQFREDAVIVSVNRGMSGYSLFSDYSFSELGISAVQPLDVVQNSNASLFSEDKTETLLLTLENPGRENVLEAVEALNALPYVEYAEPDYILTLFAEPNDPYYTKGNQYGLEKINAPAVWDMDIDGSGTVVAVIDSGSTLNHEDLADNFWVNEAELNGAEGVDDDGNGYTDDIYGYHFVNENGDPTDEVGHGTHVSGIISAVTNNGKGVASLARNVKIMPLNICDSEGNIYMSAMYKAMKYAKAMGADVINCSLGTTNLSTAPSSLTDTVKECSDIVFVCAAGNSGSDNDTSPIYPASLDLPNIIAVAATDSTDSLAAFSSGGSNYGAKSVDIAAPGKSIYSAVKSGGYGSMGGTSMACPMVAGAAALVRTKFPGLTAAEVVQRLIDTADPIDSLSGKVASGGRLNAYAALCDENDPAPSEPTDEPTPEPTPELTPEPTSEPAPKLTPEPIEVLDDFKDKLTVTENNGGLVISPIADFELPALTLYEAVYADGLLKSLTRAEGVTENGEIKITLPASEAESVETRKYMLWSEMKPVIKPIQG